MIYLDLFSTFVFALIGAQLLLKKRKSLFVVASAAIVSAIGGGTVRDLLLGENVFFWLEDMRYLVVIALAIAVACATIRTSEGRYLQSARSTELLDTFGTTIFVIVGIKVTMNAGSADLMVVMMGLLTGIGGGLLRDHVLVGKRLSQLDTLRVGIVALISVFASALLTFGVSDYLCLLIVFTFHYTINIVRINSLVTPSGNRVAT